MRLISLKSFRKKHRAANVNKNKEVIVKGIFDDACDTTVGEDESLSYQEPALYNPQRSKRVIEVIRPCNDDDTWLEIIVPLKPDPKKRTKPTRSLFYSVDRQKAYWDEPLSGASRIILSNDARNTFTTMKTNNEFDKNVWVKFICAARKSEETRLLIWNCKTGVACWYKAPKKAIKIISAGSMEYPFAVKN
mmetsp:Transcript_5240/g.7173  ORF Transcript_5240/g.7173 Transcript_5240/m.7173 type:complete len:191 (-) Transcript_5240:316-888(-)